MTWPILLYVAAAWVLVTLAFAYWRALRPDSSRVLGALALVCSASFVLQLAAFATASPGLASLAPIASSLLAPLVLHTTGAARPWLIAAYFFHPVLALVRWGEETGRLAAAWPMDPEQLQAGGWAMTALTALVYSLRSGWLAERVLLGAMVLLAIAGLLSDELWFAVLPDYLLLGFFCAALYHRERLLFFDVFFRRGLHLFTGLALMALIQPFVPHAWAPGVALGFWMLAPAIAQLADQVVEGRILRRRRRASEAEERFLRDVQAATSDDDLIHRAEASLGEIFECRTRLLPQAQPSALTHPVLVEGAPLRHACLEARRGAWPFFSRDQELLARLCRVLGIVWETLRVRERERELRQLASRAELRALRAQINPHFLFNSLNAIGGLIHTRPALADELVEKLADVFRYTLHQSDEEWVRFGREREFIESYLAIEQGRFGERLRVTQSTSPDADACWLPAMMVQPLIENAIRHGAARHPAGGSLEWSADSDGATLVIRVADNGPVPPADFAAAPRPGHAVHNIVSRLDGYFGARASLRCVRDDGRTIVTLTIPQEDRHARPDR